MSLLIHHPQKAQINRDLLIHGFTIQVLVMNVLVLIHSAKQFTLKSSIDKASLKINDRVDIINDSNKEIKVDKC